MGVSPLTILALLLALSVAGNAVMARLYLGATREAAQAGERLDQARATATACSDATEALREVADKRAAAAKIATAAAETRARTAEQRANRERSAPVAPPDAPQAQACELAQQQNAEWLKGRQK